MNNLSRAELKTLKYLGKSFPSEKDLYSYIYEKALKKAEYAKDNSEFYKDLYKNGIGDFLMLPTISEQDLINSRKLWCTSPKEISRIVSLNTSGTTGEKKRIAFSENDISRNIEFFEEGLKDIAVLGERALCLLPGENEGGVFYQIKTALKRIDVECHNSSSYKKDGDYKCIIGMPVQVLNYLKTCKSLPESVLLSADYVPESLINKIKTKYNINVFVHYGMTETCYGCAVSCKESLEMHIRYEDVFVEILDFDKDEVINPGQMGEIAVTTFHEAMPLIRYRTNDVGLMTTEKCNCGGVLPRLKKVYGRKDALKKIGNGYISIHMLDDYLFSFDEINDYQPIILNDVLILEIDGKISDEDVIYKGISDIAKDKINIDFRYKKADIKLSKRKMMV